VVNKLNAVYDKCNFNEYLTKNIDVLNFPTVGIPFHIEEFLNIIRMRGLSTILMIGDGMPKFKNDLLNINSVSLDTSVVVGKKYDVVFVFDKKLCKNINFLKCLLDENIDCGGILIGNDNVDGLTNLGIGVYRCIIDKDIWFTEKKKNVDEFLSAVKYNLPPLPSRNDLCTIINSLNLKIGVELGVARGDYSNVLLKKSSLDKLYCVDKWNDHHDEKEKIFVADRFKKFGDRVEILHSHFDDALKRFADETFDFIYIDGYAHTGQESGKTLEEWYPKLKPGGLFAGHDYDDRWPLTKKEVNKFFTKINKKFMVTTDDLNYQSWYHLKEA
jgi:predicted O-methyltransferase YrrM